MMAGALRRLDPAAGSMVFVENAGNLVCPALFELGEGRRAVITSVTEGRGRARMAAGGEEPPCGETSRIALA